MVNRDIIVMGASWGGVEAYPQLLALLSKDIPAAIFAVLHLPAGGPSLLPQIINQSSHLRAAHAADGEPIEPGRIYIAPPDMHMLLKPGFVRLLRGAKENHSRPAVDPLFRSAAQAYGERVVGVILTGLLDDGTAGLKVVRAHGGVAVVQDPQEAVCPSMPRNAIKNVEVNYVLPIAKIAALLNSLAHEEIIVEATMSKKDDRPDILERIMDGTMNLAELGEPSGFTCPDCGGSLSEKTDEGLTIYRCRVGHAYSPAHLDAEQSAAVETALWAAVRALQEREQLMRRMAHEMQLTGSAPLATGYVERAERAKEYSALVQQVFLKQRDGEDKNALEG